MSKRNTTQSKINRRAKQASQSNNLTTFSNAPNELNEYYRSLVTDDEGFYKFLEEEGY